MRDIFTAYVSNILLHLLKLDATNKEKALVLNRLSIRHPVHGAWDEINVLTWQRLNPTTASYKLVPTQIDYYVSILENVRLLVRK